MSRIAKFKTVLWILVGIGAAVGITRFIYGLGVTTNLSDNSPWGFWIGFDVMGGVALAAGGFVIAAINYIFHIKKFRHITRAAILTAFLGYIAVAVGLLFDLGLPWNIWHLIIFWNPHSPLFEVGWCVMLYLSVLFLEFAPVVLERWPNINWMRSIYNFLNKIKIPIVILGIMLSTLHQSSLGSLFLAMPYKLHPLWYTPIIPIVFFISAICLGLMMVMVESMTSSWAYRKKPETDILNSLRKGAIWMLLIYLVLRFGDIIIRGAAPFMFEASWPSFLFWTETAMSIVIPALIFFLPASAKNINWTYSGALIGVFGIVFNRLNVGGLTHLNNLKEVGEFYFPAWTELAISAMVVSLAMLAFFYFVENFKVWEEPPVDPSEDPHTKPKFSPNKVYLGPARVANRIQFSFAFVIAFGLAFAAISGRELEKKGYEIVEVTKPRGGDTLFIDGNRDMYGVEFKHVFHQQALGEDNCVKCHHMNKPDDKNTECYECHYNMYTPGNAFKHDWHASADGGNLNCFDCHTKNKYKTAETAKECIDCHEDLVPEGSPIVPDDYTTVSYVDAMHQMCTDCHKRSIEEDLELAARKPDLAKCETCHPDVQERRRREKKLFKQRRRNKWVVLPGRIKKDD